MTTIRKHVRKATSLHRERFAKMLEGRRAMLLGLIGHDPDHLPPHVDHKKLERAYRLLDDYVLVLKKKTTS